MAREFPPRRKAKVFPGEADPWRPDPLPLHRRREGLEGVEGRGYEGRPGKQNTGWFPFPADDHRSEHRIVFKDAKAPEDHLLQVYIEIEYVDDEPPWRWSTHALVNEGGTPVAHMLGGWRTPSRQAARANGLRAANSFLGSLWRETWSS